jgi:hypothetical protein
MEKKKKKYQLIIDDDGFWRAVKKKAASCEITIRIAIYELLRHWVAGDFDDIIEEFEDWDKESA